MPLTTSFKNDTKRLNRKNYALPPTVPTAYDLFGIKRIPLYYVQDHLRQFDGISHLLSAGPLDDPQTVGNADRTVYPG